MEHAQDNQFCSEITIRLWPCRENAGISLISWKSVLLFHRDFPARAAGFHLQICCDPFAIGLPNLAPLRCRVSFASAARAFLFSFFFFFFFVALSRAKLFAHICKLFVITEFYTNTFLYAFVECLSRLREGLSGFQGFTNVPSSLCWVAWYSLTVLSFFILYDLSMSNIMGVNWQDAIHLSLWFRKLSSNSVIYL